MIAYPPTATQLNSIYLRLAAAFRRQQARRAAMPSPCDAGTGGDGGGPNPLVPEPLTITQPAPVTPPSGRGRRGPYRRRAVGVTAAGRA